MLIFCFGMLASIRRLSLFTPRTTDTPMTFTIWVSSYFHLSGFCDELAQSDYPTGGCFSALEHLSWASQMLLWDARPPNPTYNGGRCDIASDLVFLPSRLPVCDRRLLYAKVWTLKTEPGASIGWQDCRTRRNCPVFKYDILYIWLLPTHC